MKKIFVIILAALALISCSRSVEVETPAQKGSFSLKLALETAKGAVSESELLSSSLINVYYADFSGLVRKYKYSEAPEKIYLPVADYRVDVIAGEAAKANPERANWDLKSYKGSSPVSIVAGQDAAVEIVAKVSNVVSSVNFDATIAEHFQPGYAVTVGIGDDAKLVYDSSKSGAEGYFIISDLVDPALTWTFSGKSAKDGSLFEKSGTIGEIEAGKLYRLSLKYTVKDGIANFDVIVDYSTAVVSDIVVFEASSTGLAPSSVYEIWAGHATVHADVDESEYPDQSKIKFEFSSDGSSWTSVDANRSSEGVYDAVLTGLSPETRYSYRLVIDGEQIGDSLTLTTDKGTPLPNGSMEYTSKSESGKYYEFYDPDSPDEASRNPWWGSGNGSKGITGSADMASEICVPDTSEKIDGNQSARLQSSWAVVKFAAGNLFTGYFAGLVGTSGGKVMFGRPFTARPTALRLYLKYSAGKVNRIDSYPSDDPVTTNDYDRARIQIAVGSWNYKTYGGNSECPILVNTTDKSSFVDFRKDSSTFGYGELILQSDSENSYNQWAQYTINLDYRNTNAFPTHIVISIASSMLGDYFTGCDEAKLWVDKAELLYE